VAQSGDPLMQSPDYSPASLQALHTLQLQM
jgi:hypothetical protein